MLGKVNIMKTFYFSNIVIPHIKLLRITSRCMIYPFNMNRARLGEVR